MAEREYQFTNKALLTTRRMALESLVLFPSSLLTAVQLSPRDDLIAEAFITPCAPCIMACAYLLKGVGDAMSEGERWSPPSQG